MASTTVVQTDRHHWPALDSKADPHQQDEWELVSPAEGIAHSQKAGSGRRQLRHCESSPDFRLYHLVEEDSVDGDADEVILENTSIVGQDDSSAVLVSAPPSVASTVSKFSFRDAILQNNHVGHGTSGQQTPSAVSEQPRVRKNKPKYVVKPIKRCARSAPDLHALLEEDDDILGDTDAGDYYARKAHGMSGRVNGLKSRPDEKKRLEITMAKKNLQRQRQAG